MKKLLMLLSALAAASLLGGCSAVEYFENLDLDSIEVPDWLLSATETELDPVKTAQEIKDSLPEELADITVNDTTLGCEVAHLAISSRETDTTRQTDEVVCRVELEGEGISVSFACTLDYTYTTSGGWGLANWSIDETSLDLEVTEGAFTQELEETTLDVLEIEYGDDSITYASGTWDQDTMTFSAVYDIDATNGNLITQGNLSLTAELEQDLSQGLYFDWDVEVDESGVLHGADIAETTWLVQGSVDSTPVELAVSIESIDINAQTVTISAASGVVEDGNSSYTIRESDDVTISYTASTEGIITFTFEHGDHSWDVCFDTEDQWARMDSSYVNSMSLKSSQYLTSDSLSEFLDETPEEEDDDSLTYDMNTGGYTYTSSDGTLVYEMQVEYPEFSGEGADVLNSAVEDAVDLFLGTPQVSTDQTSLDSLAASAQEEGSTVDLPCYDELEISVVYNDDSYLSLLLTTTEQLEDGVEVISYESMNFDLVNQTQLSDDSLYTGTNQEVGSVLLSYAEEQYYSESAVMSFVEACVFSEDGLVFYLLTDETTGETAAVTVPYSESICSLNPTA